MKFFKKLVIVFIILVALFLAGAIVITFIFSEEVKQKLVSEINKNLKTEISVREIKFSAIRKFPNASLEFRDVLIKPANSFNKIDFAGYAPDTLLSAKRIFLEFNLRDIIFKNYNIKSIQIEQGLLNLFTDSEGNENYEFWETRETGEETAVRINLQNIRIYDLHFFFINRQKELSSQFHFSSTHLKGNFSELRYRLSGRSDFIVKEIGLKNILGDASIPVKAEVELDVNGDLFTISKGKFNIGKMRFNAEGEYFGGGVNRIDLAVEGENLDLKSAGSLLIGDYLKFTQNYNPTGSLSFRGRMHGRFSRLEKPGIEGAFALIKGGLSKKGIKTKIHGLSANGTFSNGGLTSPVTYRINIESFNGSFGEGAFRGHLKVENLLNPLLTGSLLFDGNIYELTDLYKPAQLNKAEGNLRFNLLINGYLNKFKDLKPENIPMFFPEISLEVSDGLIYLQNKPWQFESINGRLQLTNKLVFEGLSFNNQGNSFVLNGELYSNEGFVFRKGAELRMKGDVHSPFLNMDIFLPDPEARTTGKKVLRFPEKLHTDVRFSCDNFIFRNFRANNLSGNITYKPKMFTLNSISFQSMNGSVLGGGAIIQKMNNDFLFQAQTSLKNINISNLFYSFNNFGQKFITNNHLNGSLTGSLNFISEWDNNFNLITEKIVADSRIQITGGELINFEPMNSLSRFVELEELRHIRFSKIQNEIFIRNQIVTIPAMDIQSSAFNINISGTHNFDNNFNYRLRVILSDVLFAKAKRVKKENEQFAIVEEDRLRRTILPIIISGTPDNFNISYDRRAAAEIIRDGFNQGKITLRNILNEEFGLFSNDTLQNQSNQLQQKSPAFILEWDEEEKKQIPGQIQQQRKETEKRPFKITWEEDQKQDTAKRKKSFEF